MRAVDIDAAAVATLERGVLPILEPSLDSLFAEARGCLTFSADPSALGACPLVVISRDVPTDPANRADPSVVLDLVDAVLPHLRPGVTLALMSQVPPGFTRALGERIRARRPALDFSLYYWIETLVFGDAVARYLRPERIMLGCADPETPVAALLMEGLGRFACPVLPMRYESAELAKTAINLYLCAAVTFANTFADLCEACGADWGEMMPALRLDRRIGPAAYIRPGLGIAGGNLERDLLTLQAVSRRTGVDAAFVDVMIDYNARRASRWLRRKLEEEVFRAVPHPVIGVWGLAYKKNTRSTRNSMAVRAIEELAGRAEVRAYDPVVPAGVLNVPAKIVAGPEEAVAGADCLLIMTDWDEFAAPPAEVFRTMRRPLVIDCVGVLDRRRADLAGVRHVVMGRGGR